MRVQAMIGVLSGYRVMWMLVMFDLPVLTKKERKAASDFRTHLQNLGFERCQFSVYMRCCPGKEKIEFYVRKIKARLPEGGRVDILSFTDRQFENIISFQASARKNSKNKHSSAFFSWAGLLLGRDPSFFSARA